VRGVIVAAVLAGVVSAGLSSTSGASSPKGVAASGGPTVKTPLGTVSVNKVYVPGVPSLAQLYKSTETTPPATSPPIAPGKSVVWMSCGQTANGCAGPAADFAKVAKLVGWKYSVVDGALDVNNGYATAMAQAIAEKPDAIVLWGENCADVKQAVIAADAAHILVFGAGSADCSDRFTPGGAEAALYGGHVIFNKSATNISKLYEQIGEQQAAAAIDASKGHARIIRDTFQGGFGLWEQAGQDAVLKKCSACSVVADIPWTPAQSAPGGSLFQGFNTDLAAHPEANVAMFSFDSICTGLALCKAIVDAKRSNHMYVIAAEGYAAGMTLIREHAGLQAEPSYDAVWASSWATADELNRLFNHKPLVPEGSGVRVVDATHNLPPSGSDYISPVNYQSAYKKIWRVK